MTSRERMIAALRRLPGQMPDRVPMADAPWPEALERWHREGLPEGMDASDYFDFDITAALRIDTSLQLPSETIEATEEYTVVRDANGMIGKHWKHASGTPQLLDFIIHSREDWDKYKPRLVANRQRLSLSRWGEYETGGGSVVRPFDRIRPEYQEACDRGKFLMLGIAEAYESVWPLMGPENLLPAMVEDPAWAAEMFDTEADLIMACTELLLAEGYRPDGVFMGGDIAYKNGLLFSPTTYRQTLMPAHRRLCQFFASKGIAVIYHTDGYVGEALPLLIETGIDAIQPLEVQCGNDVREYKRLYGDRVALMGNIGVRAMEEGRDAVEREIRAKLPVAMAGGGYIYHSDHSIPPTVSFETFCHVVELVREIGQYGG